MTIIQLTVTASVILIHTLMITSWVPDENTKLHLKYDPESWPMFGGNATKYFKLLDQDDNTILIGSQNVVHNISLTGLLENSEQRIDWFPSKTHRRICAIKGKQEIDCLNYIRVYAKMSDTRIMICGTNAYKPYCQEYEMQQNGKYQIDIKYSAEGICPYGPNNNSTYIYTDGQLYSATVADFSGADPLIYREGQRTEQYELKQLNQPDFISTLEHNGYLFFFFREIAMEYMNCNKMIYSRVGRVCKNDKGGPHQFINRWTSFLKARLNCSIPGNYPFYFDEIQATSKIIEGLYTNNKHSLIYAVFTTPQSSFIASAVCAFRVNDILDAFEGRFKGQQDKNNNSNWSPIPVDEVPLPRPGSCVKNSRTLPSIAVSFVKQHPLMERVVPSFYRQPLLIRDSSKYRFTSITVDPQIESLNGEKHDVVFVGTDDGKIIKFINILPTSIDTKLETNIISEWQVFPVGVEITELTISHKTQSLIVIGNERIVAIPLFHCNKTTRSNGCLRLQDPYCIWDIKSQECISKTTAANQLNVEEFIQDIRGLHLSQYQPSMKTTYFRSTVGSSGQSINNYNDSLEIKINWTDQIQLTITINHTNVASDQNLKEQWLSIILYVTLGFVFVVIGVLIGLRVSKYNYFNNQHYNHENSNELNWSLLKTIRRTFGLHQGGTPNVMQSNL